MALDSVLDFEPAKQLTVTITSYPGSHRLGGFPAVRECNALPTSCPQFVVYRSMSSCVESFEQNLSARFLGSVDADGVGRRGCGRLAAEPFGVRGVVGLLGGVALLPEGAPAPVVDLIR